MMSTKWLIASRRCWKQYISPIHQTIGYQPDPFTQALVESVETGQQIRTPGQFAGAPVIHRIRQDRPAGAPEDTDGARHVGRRGYQQPSFTGPRIDQRAAEEGIFIGVARLALEGDAREIEAQ